MTQKLTKDQDCRNYKVRLKLKKTVKTPNEEIEEILEDKDPNLTEINHLIHAVATGNTEKVNGTGS